MNLFNSIHNLVTHLTEEMVDARPAKSTLDAFRRAGRRDSRRGVPWEAAHQYLEEAVQLAAMQHVHDLRDDLDAAADESRRLGQDLVHIEQSITALEQQSSAGPDQSTNGSFPAERSDHDDDKATALALLTRARAARHVESVSSQLTAARDRRDGIRGQMEAQADTIRDLHRGCRERISATVEAGQLLWTRYCAGYMHGASGEQHPPTLLAVTVDSSVAAELRWMGAEAAAGPAMVGGHDPSGTTDRSHRPW